MMELSELPKKDKFIGDKDIEENMTKNLGSLRYKKYKVNKKFINN